MQVVRVTSSENLKQAIKLAKNVIEQGGLIIYPTDTVYGLGADPFNIRAVERVFQVKRRSKKPLPILASSISNVLRICELNETATKLVRNFWPGALTIVVKKKEGILPNIVTAGMDSVGIRIPKHEVALKIIDACGGLLIGTSANISGHKPPRTAEEAIAELGDLVDLVIDSGSAPLGKPSTVINLTVSPPVIEREGVIKAEDILKVLRT